MRDKKRIQPFLKELEAHWNKVPDWRFGQLMTNVFSSCDGDPFYYEDDKMLRLFHEFFNETEDKIK